jgi:hypothetical protein
MIPRPLTALAAALALVGAAAIGRSQDAPRPEPAPAPEAPRPPDAPPPSDAPRPAPRTDRLPTSTMQVQIVISRFQGERKVASLPYSFLVPAVPVAVGPGPNRARMRMGIDTPVPKTTAGGTTEVQYRNVGTNIDCWVGDLGDGRHQVNLTVENSSALAGSEAGSGSATASGFPLFRRFETSLAPILRPGQSVQTVASTDPVTGEVVKIDVTLNVVR